MEVLFEERQYLGYNKFSILRRTLIAIFCFSVYFFSENDQLQHLVGDKVPGNIEEDTAPIFFLMGIVILVLSVLLIFVLHIKTIVQTNSLIIDGLWTARKVKIDLNAIVGIRKVKYSKYLLNRPVYNLHRKGKIRFFTMGNEAVELRDRDGLLYIIGSQRANELLAVLAERLKLTPLS
jgi:hypothetical protein